MNRYLSPRTRFLRAQALATLLAVLASPALFAVDADDLSAFVDRGMTQWQVPGAAVTVVSADEVLYQRSFGVTTPGGAAIDEHTLFANASTTKAMVAAGVLMLAEDGKLALDDPATRYVPGLSFADPLLTAQVTVRDLLTHQTGLPRTDFWTFLHDLPLEDQLLRLQEVEPAAPLRTRHIYQNTMYEIAGLIIERVSGQRWDRFLSERLWGPIGMDETFGARAAFGDRPHVLPHDVIDGELQVVDWDLPADRADAAGSAWTSIRDMGLWAQFLLRGGVTANGDRLISEAGVEDLFRPQGLIALADFYPTAKLTRPHWMSYGLGWFQQDFQGRKIDFHTGSLSGLVALVGLDRDSSRAMVILANRDHAEMRHAVLWEIMDQRPAGQGQDWNDAVYALYQEAERETEARREEQEKQRLRRTRPSLPLEQYAGHYDNALLGPIEVVVQGKQLVLRAGQVDLPARHWHVDTFEVEYAPWQLRDFAVFRLAPTGEIAGFSFFGQDLERVSAAD